MAGRNRQAPFLRLVAVQEQPTLNTKILKFVETCNSIPILGSNVVVELDENQDLVSVSGQLTSVHDVDSVPSITEEDAFHRLQNYTQSAGWQTQPPERNFYLDDSQKWHLVYLFHNVPAEPPNLNDDMEKYATSRFGLRFNYLVDAHDGSVLDFYRSAPGIESTTAQR